MKIPLSWFVLFALAISAGAQTNATPENRAHWMEQIIIPAVEFREASAMDVLDFLFEATQSPTESDRSIALIHPTPNAPRTIATFELEDGSAPDLPGLDFSAQRLPMLQAIDLICGYAGIQFAIDEAGPEFFLPDGRRLIRKEVPAPPPEIPPSAEVDAWGFGGDFGGPGEIAPVQPDGIDWEPLVRSPGATPDVREAILTEMGFTCTRHKGEYAHLRDPSGLSAGLHPMDYILGERQEGDTRWTVRIFIDENGLANGLAIHPHPGF